jgi:ABC-type uncharacterized transport system ATPase subunit
MDVGLNRITKRFGDILANDRISLQVHAGEVMALLGENGAGKSTLMKILYGLYRPDEGEIILDNQHVRFHSPNDARAAGIGMVFQNFNLIPALTVAENLEFANLSRGWRIQGKHSLAARYLHRLAPQIELTRLVAELSVGECQLVELAKILGSKAKVIIFDEPTSVLGPNETKELYIRIRDLAAEGKTVIMITHKLDDVMSCAGRVVVLRKGRPVYEGAVAATSKQSLVRHFIGEKGAVLPSREKPRARRQLSVRGVYASRRGESITDLSFDLNEGEVFGIAGVSGNGQQLLADIVSGLAQPGRGEVLVNDESVYNSRLDRKHIGFIPEAPIRNSVAGDLSLKINFSFKELAKTPWFRPLSRRDDLRETLLRCDVRPPDPDLPAKKLSGGNLQKFVLGRELLQQCKLIVACYPTMGLDLAAGRSVYAQLLQQAQKGASVLWISEDLDELLNYTNRLAVLFKGRLSPVVESAKAARDQIGYWMAGAI